MKRNPSDAAPSARTPAEVRAAQERLDRFLARPEVLELTGLSNTTLWREINAGRFPRPIPISRSRVGFLESDVRQWMHAKIADAESLYELR
jgi:prophage regulatory protein